LDLVFCWAAGFVTGTALLDERVPSSFSMDEMPFARCPDRRRYTIGWGRNFDCLVQIEFGYSFMCIVLFFVASTVMTSPSLLATRL
jgi:hypothetical protein